MKSSNSKRQSPAILCPCRVHERSILRYSECCEPIHLGRIPDSAEALMRSRYSAFVFKFADYLLASWHPSTRPERIEFDSSKWLRLEVHEHERLSTNEARVRFTAVYRDASGAHKLHELSEFVFEQGRWFYLRAVQAT
jgi:SEC-C motif domain protein